MAWLLPEGLRDKKHSGYLLIVERDTWVFCFQQGSVLAVNFEF